MIRRHLMHFAKNSVIFVAFVVVFSACRSTHLTLEDRSSAKRQINAEKRSDPLPPNSGPDDVPDSYDMPESAPPSISPALPKFPWPPPRASALALIPRALLVRSPKTTLGDISDAIDAAFNETGYSTRNYYSIPDGFAMASAIEQINDDGTSKTPELRWRLDPPTMEKFSLRVYLSALFKAPPGHYRVIVFAVTSQPFTQRDVKVARKEAVAWLRSGISDLPKELRSREFSADHKCSALIYEFKGGGDQAQLIDPSRIQGQTHLVKSGLLAALSRTSGRRPHAP